MASLAFTVIAGAISLALIGVALSSVSAANVANTDASMSSATEARFSQYTTELNTGKIPNAAPVCYETLRTCVSIFSSSASAATRTVTLEAVYGDNERSKKQTRSLAVTGGTHITGFDSLGEPIWGTVTASRGTRFTSVATSAARSCALDTLQFAWCWGGSSVGDGTTTVRTAPVRVSVSTKFTSVTVDRTSTPSVSCAIDTVRKAWCWGSNTAGGLGVNLAADPVLSPTRVNTTLDLTQIIADSRSICALDTTGAAYCWGANQNGRAGTTSVSATVNAPTAVNTASRFVTLAHQGGLTCGTTSAGAVTCWGNLPTDGSKLVPTLISGAPMSKVSLGGASAVCATRISDGALFCSNPTITSFVSVPGPVFAQITGNGGTSCGITSGSALHCWGANGVGQIGDGTSTARTQPVAVAPSVKFTSVSVRGNSTCAVDDHRKAWCWGDNAAGRLGVGSASATVPAPTKVIGGQLFAQVTTSTNGASALDHRGNLFGWGANTGGQVGDSSTIARPAPVIATVPTSAIVFKPFSGYTG